LINKAHQVLGDEIKKKTYDWCLSTDEEGFYINRKKLAQIMKSRALVDEEFGREIELILQNELEVKGRIWEELNYHGEKIWEREKEFRKQKEGEIELLKIEDFCQDTLQGLSQYEAILLTRRYLSILSNIMKLMEKKGVGKREGKQGYTKFVYEFLKKEEPILTKEELDEPGEVNWIEKIEQLDIKGNYERNKKRRKEILDKQLPELYVKVRQKIKETRAGKSKLLKEWDEKIAEGNLLLGSKVDKKTIEKFLTELNDFFSLKGKETCEVEAGMLTDGEIRNKKVVVNQEVIKQVIETKEGEISWLKEQLEGLLNGEVTKV